jgi:ketosteroid isomerase-like protein
MIDKFTAAITEYMNAVAAKDIDRVVDVHTERAVLEFPYAPAGFPSRVEGRAAIRALFERPVRENLASRFFDLQVNLLREKDMAVAEYRGEIELPSGANYNNSYCLIFSVQGFRFDYVREYFNPQIHDDADMGSYQKRS